MHLWLDYFKNKKKSGESLTIVGDGKQRRDFTHVDDVVDAIKLFLYANATWNNLFC